MAAIGGAAVGGLLTAGPAEAEETFVVTTTADSGAGSLRAAILAANSAPGPDVLIFELPPDSVIDVLTPMLVSQPVHIDGARALNLTVRGDGTRRILVINAGAVETTAISGLTISGAGGPQPGGAIYAVNSAVALDDVRLVDNTSGDVGGALMVRGGRLTIARSVISDNRAAGAGGGVATVDADLYVKSSRIARNTAGGEDPEAHGGGLYVQSGEVEMRGVSIVENEATGDGGGLMVSTGKALLADLEVVDNTGVNGGGIASRGTLGTSVLESVVRDNEASQAGGGVFIADTDNSRVSGTVDGNTAQRGGGVALSATRTDVVQATLSRNTAAITGAALSAETGAEVRVDTSTISEKTSGSSSQPHGAVVDLGGGGQVAAPSSLRHVTIADNTGEVGVVIGPQPVTVTDTIVHGTAGGNDLETIGTDADVAYSLIGATVDSFDGLGVLVDTDPQLAPLADNGGRMQTMLPAAGSPVIDAGTPEPLDSAGPPNEADQRTAFRVLASRDGVLARRDMGAVEWTWSASPPGSAPSNPSTGGTPTSTPPTSTPPTDTPPTVQLPPLDVPSTPTPTVVPPVSAPPVPETAAPTGPQRPVVPPTPPSTPLTLTTDRGAISTIDPGQALTVVGTGFRPFSLATIVIYSTPIVLGEVMTDAAGDFRTTVTVPASLEAGAHSLVASGTAPDGSSRYLRMDVVMDAPAPAAVTDGGPQLAETGASIALPVLAGLGLLAAGAGLLVAARRRAVQN
ncbi:LPXTG cell wall anchor domain-containing protein [Modestobacter sp. I12A-02628]|uniref:LPXTG cell wall anchor domain-containing protein n=1 Tax=Goekera deserti TaxID=2497753 RepID=A0A7K3W8D8_9ACTN|nr:choice-of-anchor Q domain-containing protein [Goekera deserti]MPQ99771.1 LPXTG cell wall anchor domain-containing protein [Goekera deserti]NDI49530.1 LPXTG cell wall anchor domain-containing protein [Goekera deserti]NEL52596.1 LPXTG cell wall anchor domain-containing protein [Goekera deserti]